MNPTSPYPSTSEPTSAHSLGPALPAVPARTVCRVGPGLTGVGAVCGAAWPRTGAVSTMAASVAGLYHMWHPLQDPCHVQHESLTGWR